MVSFELAEIEKAGLTCVISRGVSMDEYLIAPCGMNCILCIAYQFKENDINKRGLHKKVMSMMHSERRKLHAYERCVRIAGNGQHQVLL